MTVSSVSNCLRGAVALVTGGSRGIGKGIAKHLVDSGADVFITGRKPEGSGSLPSIMETAEELNKPQLGKCYPVFCDHKIDGQINSLFDQIYKIHPKLNILVNNAFSGGENFKDLVNKNFWEPDPYVLWDKVIEGGLKSSYICSTKAARLMIPHRSGLIVNISSIGGLVPVFGALYAMGKSATDTMTKNMGLALKPHSISVVSLWPGIVKTERSKEAFEKGSKEVVSMWDIAEDPTLVGKAVRYLYLDDNLPVKSGKIHMVADLAHQYHFKDVGNVTPTSFRSMRFAVHRISPTLSKIVPHSIKVPGWFLETIFNKF